MYLWQQDLVSHDLFSAVEKRRLYSIQTLSETVLLCKHLRSDANLKSVILAACRIVLPAVAAQEITALVKSTDDKRQFHISCPSTVARARFHVDVAYSLTLRQKFQAGQGARVNLMVDSRHQGGRDYELMVMIVVGVESLPLAYL